jgi:hypothetical protein
LIPLSGVSDWDVYSSAVSTLMISHEDAELKELAVNDQAIEYVTARVVLKSLDSRWRQIQSGPADKEHFLQEDLKAFGAKAGVRYSPSCETGGISYRR